MSKIFIVPDHLHQSSRVLSCSDEAGLCAAAPVNGSSNAGRLRLSAAGGTEEAVELDLLLRTGGNPYGYRLADNYTGNGASVVWKNSADGTTSYRGYVDTPYFVRSWTLTAASSTNDVYGGIRQLANGRLGVVFDDGNAVFRSYSRTHSLSSGAIPDAVTGAGFSSDFVVLPSGRIVVAMVQDTGGTAGWTTYYSDDNGSNWYTLNRQAINGDLSVAEIAMEAVDDLIVAVISLSGNPPQVWTSYDGGCTFEKTGTASGNNTNVRTCVTKTGRVLAIMTGTVNSEVYEIIPGGGFGRAVQANIGEYDSEHAIIARDDGTIWCFAANTTASNVGDLECSVSYDDGVTFTQAAGSQKVFNLHDTPTARPLTRLRGTCWRGRIVLLALTQADSGTDYNWILLEFGEWASVTDVRNNVTSNGQPYEHSYVGAIDYPNALGWTRTDAGGGATVTNNTGYLRILCATTNTYYTASGTFWTASAGVGKRIRFRVKVDTAGSLTQDHAFVRWSISDGANAQAVTIRFATTGFRVVDGAANVLADITETMTNWTDFFVAFLHDATATPTGAISVWHRQDADDEGLWTADLSNGTVAEIVSAASYLDFGGTSTVGVTVDWSIANLQVADDDNDIAEGITNPIALAGRPIPASVPMWIGRGLKASGFNGAGVPDDSYVLATTYQWGKENVWAEFRPSRQVRSSADNATWTLVFDAGANSVFSVQHVAVFGTNNRQITFQMHTADSWASPSISQALTTVVSTGTVGSSNRGPGYFGPTVSPNWIRSQYKSDGLAHRWFVSVNSQTYEIQDNDASALYVPDVDFSGVTGTYYIFADRGATDLGAIRRYRYMRLVYTAEQTADDYYRLGTMIAAVGYTPTIEYAHNFVDVVETNLETVESIAGIEGTSVLGADRRSLQIQWEPINRMHPVYGRVGEEMEAFFRTLRGAKVPVVLWRDNSDVSTLGLYTVSPTFARPNLRGEGASGLARVDVITLRELL